MVPPIPLRVRGGGQERPTQQRRTNDVSACEGFHGLTVVLPLSIVNTLTLEG